MSNIINTKGEELSLENIGSPEVRELAEKLLSENIENSKIVITDNGKAFFVREGENSGFVHIHGDGSYREMYSPNDGIDRTTYFLDDMRNADPDDLIVYSLNLDRGGSYDANKDSVEIAEVMNMYDVKNLAVNGFSRGGTSALKTAADINQQNPGTVNLVVMTAGSIEGGLKDSDLENLRGTTCIVCWDENDARDGRWNYYKNYVKNYDMEIYSIKDIKGGHGKWLEEAYANDIVNFALSKGNFSEESTLNDEFIFQKCTLDENGNPVWTDVSYSEFANHIKQNRVKTLMKYCNNIKPMKCDNAFIEDNVNYIIGIINKLNEYKNSNSSYYDSTTTVPNIENDKINDFIEKVMLTIFNVEKNLKNIVYIGNSIEKIEQEKVKEIEYLDI